MNDRLQATVGRFNAMLEDLKREVIGRGDLIRQIGYALLTRQHVLIEGPPGVAKSYLAKKVFERITDARTFHIQCTRKMTEDSIVGPPNVKIMREHGRFEHNVEGTLVTSHYGFLDEVFDLSSGALRALLEILNERTFSRGRQRVRSPLQTAIATTNFNRDGDEELAAVLDRFLFRAKVRSLESRSERQRMLLLEPATNKATISRSDLEYLQRSINRVKVPEHVLDCYLAVCEGISPCITDRRLRHALEVLKASALLAGRTRATVNDVGTLDVVFVTSGDRASENAWGASLSPYSQALEDQGNRESFILLLDRLSQLRYLAIQAEDYAGIEDTAAETMKAKAALEMLKTANTSTMFNRGMKVVNEIIELADYLYNDTVKAP